MKKENPEFAWQRLIEKKAKSIGSSFPKLIDAITNEFKDIQFKGIEFTKITVTFQIDPHSIHPPTMTVCIWCSALPVEENNKFLEDSRNFTVPYRNQDFETIFFVIYFWKKRIIEHYQKLLKPQKAKTLFDE